MKRLETKVVAFGLLALLPVLESCKSRTNNEDVPNPTSGVKDAPPSDTTRSVHCDLAPQSASATNATFAGRAIKYHSSAEIPYETENWWKPGSPWYSADLLDSTMLGHPGYPSPNRASAPTVPTNSRVVAIDVRNIDGTLKYHYFSNETGTSPMENWSSTKSLAMLMAAHSVRLQTGKSFMSRMYSAGSGGSSSGWIGDHVNDVARTSNNNTAVWFKSITGGSQSNNFAKNWLTSSAQFGGGHGGDPAQFGSWVREDDMGERKKLTRAGSWTPSGDNTLMPIVMAEFWKRLAVNTRDARTWLKATDYTVSPVDSATRQSRFFPSATNFGVTETDLKVLLYGFVNSTSLGGLQLGATSHDEFVSAIGGKTKLDGLTGGKWRFFGKTGSGRGSRGGAEQGESVFGGYVCIPANTRGSKFGRLVAFFINTRSTGDAPAKRAQTLAGLANVMLPEIKGTTSRWGGSTGPAPAPVPVPLVSGEATSTAVSLLKHLPVDSALITNSAGKQDKKCQLPAGSKLAYTNREQAAGNHSKLKLKSVNASCPDMPLEVNVFNPHWNFVDGD